MCSLITLKIILLLLTIIGCVLNWVFYGVSWRGIQQTTAMITDIDTSLTDDCDIWQEKYDNGAIFYYNYTYGGVAYDGSYDICETNGGVKTHLKLHPIGSEITIFLKADDPSESYPSKEDLTNKWCLAFGIIFGLILLCMFTYLTCAFDEVSKELRKLFAKEVSNKVGVGLNQF